MKNRKSHAPKIRIAVAITLVLVLLIFFNYTVPSSNVLADTATTSIFVGSDEDLSEDAIVEDEVQQDTKDEEIEIVETEEDIKGDIEEDTLQEIITEEDLISTQETEQELLDVTNLQETTDNLEDTQLLDNEVIVYSYDELKQYIQSSGNNRTYDTYYLGANIEAKSGGISVPANYQFTIDGTHPFTKERFTYYEYRSAASTQAIHYSAASNSTMKVLKMRNIDIEGQNYYGTMTSTVANVTMHYENVNYTGPQLGYSLASSVIFEDCTINIVRGRASVAQEIVEAKDVFMRGHSVFTVDSAAAIMFNVTSSLVFEDSSNSEFISNRRMIYHDGTSVSVGTNALVTYNSNPATPTITTDTLIRTKAFNNKGNIEVNHPSFTGSVITSVNTFENNGSIRIQSNKVTYDVLTVTNYFMNTGLIDIDIEQVGRYGINVIANKVGNFVIDGGTINIKGKTYTNSVIYSYYLDVKNGATLNIHINTHGGYGMMYIYQEILVSDSTMNISSGSSTANTGARMIYLSNLNSSVVFNNSKVTIDTGLSSYGTIFQMYNWTFVSDATKPSYLVINMPEMTRTFVTNIGSGKTQIFTQQVNMWQTAPTFTEYPNEDIKASERYAFRSNQDISMVFRSNGTSATILPGGTGNTDFNHTDQIPATNRKLISMGSLILESPKNIEDNKLLQVQTNPNAWIQLQTNPKYETYADDSGLVLDVLENSISNGEYVLKSYANYLYRETPIVYEVDGLLQIQSVPSQLDFGKVKLKGEPTYYPRQSAAHIVVSDQRINKTGWKLSVHAQTPLHIKGRTNTDLSDALVYKEDGLYTSIESEPVVIYETSNNYDSQVTIDWEVDKGIQLFMNNYNSVYANEKYQTNLVWVLESK